MKRSIGDTATDPQTGWTWVCLGDRGPELGALWSVYGDRGQQYSAVEWDSVRPANDGLERALAAGVTPAGGLALAPYKKLAEAAQDELRWHDETSHKALKAALDGLPEG